ncbi:hypothetical protein ONZ45_g10574 [Pleurotus djamor]|nr:hypothetical protein ONZ45_g10574 [Pleurotus djamor]
MIKQIPIDQVFLLATWLEGLAYGFLVCLFFGTLLFSFGSSKRHDRHTLVMIFISCVMFFIATFHFAMNGYRLVQGFSVHVNAKGGGAAYIGNLQLWDHILKDTLYATQEILGNAAAIYRCFILWNHDWRIIAVPVMLLIGSIVSGYSVCGLYVQIDPSKTVFDPRLNHWILAFYSIAVVQNVITTGLMAYRIWSTSSKSAKYKTENLLLPVLRILVESAAMQLIIEILLLALYSQDINAQYILLEMVTPVVGITFNAITLRIRLRTLASPSNNSYQLSRSDPVQTIGSAPSRKIKVDITTQIEDDSDPKASHSRGSMA